MTDYYVECETGLMTMLRTLTTYFEHSWQVSDDDSVMTKGASCFVILRPGEFPTTRLGEGIYGTTWVVVADVAVSFTDYKNSWSKFKALRSAIINLIMQNPTLNDTAGVVRVVVSSRENAQYLKFSDVPDARPNYIIQTMEFAIYQYVQYPVESL